MINVEGNKEMVNRNFELAEQPTQNKIHKNKRYRKMLDYYAGCSGRRGIKKGKRNEK